MDFTIGQGLTLCAAAYVATHIVVVFLTRWLDARFLRLRLESEERQAMIAADASVKVGGAFNVQHGKEG